MHLYANDHFWGSYQKMANLGVIEFDLFYIPVWFIHKQNSQMTEKYVLSNQWKIIANFWYINASITTWVRALFLQLFFTDVCQSLWSMHRQINIFVMKVYFLFVYGLEKTMHISCLKKKNRISPSKTAQLTINRFPVIFKCTFQVTTYLIEKCQ